MISDELRDEYFQATGKRVVTRLVGAHHYVDVYFVDWLAEYRDGLDKENTALNSEVMDVDSKNIELVDKNQALQEENVSLKEQIIDLKMTNDLLNEALTAQQEAE